MRVPSVEELEAIDCLPCRVAVVSAVAREKGWLPAPLAERRRVWAQAARAAGFPAVLLAARASLTLGRISQMLAGKDRAAS